MLVILRAEGPKDPKLDCGAASLGRSFAWDARQPAPRPPNKKGGLSAALLTRFSLRLTR